MQHCGHELDRHAACMMILSYAFRDHHWPQQAWSGFALQRWRWQHLFSCYCFRVLHLNATMRIGMGRVQWRMRVHVQLPRPKTEGREFHIACADRRHSVGMPCCSNACSSFSGKLSTRNVKYAICSRRFVLAYFPVSVLRQLHGRSAYPCHPIHGLKC